MKRKLGRLLELAALILLGASFGVLKKVFPVFADLAASFQIRFPFFLPPLLFLVVRLFWILQLLTLLAAVAVALSFTGIDGGAVERFRERVSFKLAQNGPGAWIIRRRFHLFSVWILIMLSLCLFLARLPVMKIPYTGR
jgi:hypothetical protein